MTTLKDTNITLNEIFKHYKKEYNLNTELTFYLSYGSCYSPLLNKINIDYDYLIYIDKRKKTLKRHHYNSFLELSVIVLLHEIKHAIDYKKDPVHFNKAVNDMLIYPKRFGLLEKNADKFANIEILKWKKHLC